MGGLLLACGHPISAVVAADEGAFCGACQRDQQSGREPHGPEDSAALTPGQVEAHGEDSTGTPAALSPGQVTAHADDNADGTDHGDEERSPRRRRSDHGDEANGDGSSERREGQEPTGDGGDAEAERGSLIDEKTRAQVGADGASEEGQDEEGEQGLDWPPQPAHGTRAEQAGPRGCWAITVAGQPCRAPAVNGGPFCNAHAGVGVARDPLAYSSEGHEARRRKIETRARMRLMLGNVRTDTPRGALKAAAFAQSERLAGRVLGAALSPETDDAKAAGIALAVIREVDPSQEASVEISGDVDLNSLSYSQLLGLAAQYGIDPQGQDSTPPEALEAAE